MEPEKLNLISMVTEVNRVEMEQKNKFYKRELKLYAEKEKREWLTFFKVPRETQFSNSFFWSWTCFDVENQLSAYRRCRKWLTSGQVSRQTCPTSFLKHEHCCCLLTWTDVGRLRGRSIRFFSTNWSWITPLLLKSLFNPWTWWFDWEAMHNCLYTQI